MLTGLHFETATPAQPSAPNRADVTCFVGYVARRARTPLPQAIRRQLRVAGWIGGPWEPPADRLEALLHVPVVLDSWDAFEQLFAWDQRVLRAQGGERCASYLGAAVRSFFANGGRRAVIVRCGDPWPYLDGEDRAALRRERLAALLPALAVGARPFDPNEPGSWRGLEQLYGLAETSLLCLPDLADACAPEPEPPDLINLPPAAPEVFTECSAEEPPLPADLGLRFVSAPRLDTAGFEAWRNAVAQLRDFLARHRRDVIFVGNLPLAQPDARLAGGARSYAQADSLAFLRGIGALETAGAGSAPPASLASAFVQLAWPWLQTTRSADLPQQLEAPEGPLAGVLARNALERGTYRSIAGTRMGEVVACVPELDIGLGADSPTARLAERLCLVGAEPDGLAILSDVTTSADRAWRGGGASRLMSSLLRAARRVGEEQLFETNGPALWTRIRRSLEALLDHWWEAGGLGGDSRAEAYEVRCDRSTMSQNDLDNGRVKVEISVLPAAAIERITVVLDLVGAGAQISVREVV